MNLELRDLFEADQNDRRTAPSPEIIERDRQRRTRALEIITVSVDDLAAEDCLHAAFIFQHGEAADDHWRAHELARRVPPLAEALRRVEELNRRGPFMSPR